MAHGKGFTWGYVAFSAAIRGEVKAMTPSRQRKTASLTNEGSGVGMR